MPTTLTDLATEWLDRATAAEGAAQSEVAAAQAALASARAAHQSAVAAVAEQEDAIEEIRDDLAAADTTAEGEALLADLEAATIEHRARIAAALAAGRAVDEADTAADAAAAGLAAARSDVAKRQAEADAAAASHERREATKALVNGDLNSAPGEAGTALGSSEATDAAARVAAAIPTALRDRSRARVAQERSEIAATEAARDDAASAVNAFITAAHTAAGDVRSRQADFDAADRALKSYAATASGSLARGQALLAAVAAAADPDPDQAAAVADAALATPGEAAATAEDDRDTKALEVAAAQRAVDQAILEARLDDPDVDLGTVTDVTDAETTLATLEGELAPLQTAYDGAKADLDAWEAAVPDDEWRLLEKLDTAERLLNGLQGVTPGDLVTAATTAETDLVAALEAYDQELRARDIGESAITATAAAAATRRADQQAHGFSRLRGDD